MALQLGSRLGPYEIQAPIGAGGMGEVYRATDTKLNRDVALKVLPDAFAQDADRMARFQREAHVLASLNHPNIAAIYGLEEADASHFSVASTGSLAYLPGGGTAAFDLVWTTREGQETPVGAELRSYRWARVSPDGTRLAVGIGANDRNDDVWIYELSRGTLTRLTFDEAFDGFPLWSPDGSRVVFQSLREGGGLYWKAANGTGEVERLLENPNAPRPYGWAADGRLVFDQNTEAIAAVGLEGDRAPELIIESGANPAMSPDGRWIAYNSRESGQSHIYVRPFPNVNDGKWQVSSEPGFDPLWSPDGRELFFNSLAGMMVAQVETEPTFNHGAPARSLLRPGTPVAGTEFDIAPDGERFLFLSTEPEAADQSLILVQNWYQELLERVPVP